MRFTSLSNVVGVLFALAFTTIVRSQSTDDTGNLETMPSIIDTSPGGTVIIPTGITQAPGPVIPSSTGPLSVNSTGATSISTTTNSTGTPTSSDSGSSPSTTGAAVRSLDSTGVIVAGVLIITGAGTLIQF